jgi:hypothetical protein
MVMRSESGDRPGGQVKYCNRGIPLKVAQLPLNLKMNQGFPRYQQIASIAPTIIGRIG